MPLPQETPVEYEKFYRAYDRTLRNFLKDMFTEEYTQGWSLSSITREDDDHWILRWSKDFNQIVLPSEGEVKITNTL